MTVDELLSMGLTPVEFTAACVMLTRADGDVVRASVDQIAGTMNCSRSTAHRAVQNLISRGLFQRVANGVYLVHGVKAKVPPTGQEVPPVGQKVSPAGQRGYVYQDDMTTSRHMSIEEPKGSSISGGTPLKGMERELPNNYIDDGDGLFGVGRTSPPPARKTRHSRKRDLKYHRLTPREQWTVAFVAKEFRHRMTLARPDILGGGVDGASLTKVLNLWHREHDLSVEDMVTAVDLFFENAETIAALSETPAPYRIFLRFLQTQYRSITASQITDDWIASLDAQMETL